MPPGLNLVLFIFAPLVLGLVLGLLQLFAYMIMAKTGSMEPDQVPPFPILWMRGMLVVVALGVAMAIWQHTS